MTAWEFNQLTKPDSTGRDGEPLWQYSNDQICEATEYDQVEGNAISWIYPDGSSCPGPNGEYTTSRFLMDNQQFAWNPEKLVTEVDYREDQIRYHEIMGHIIPARTEALGQLTGTPAEAHDREDNQGFTDSNQGHSAQFHGYLSEPHRGRGNYWLRVMEEGLDLRPDIERSYSVLYTNSLKVGQ